MGCDPNPGYAAEYEDFQKRSVVLHDTDTSWEPPIVLIPVDGCEGDISPSHWDNSELFKTWSPDFSINTPAFDRLNRPYIRERGKAYDRAPGRHQAMSYRKNGWRSNDYIDDIEEFIHDGDTEENENVLRDTDDTDTGNFFHQGGNGNQTAKIVFDKDGDMYTAVQVTTQHTVTKSYKYHTLLLHSRDGGNSWDVHAFSMRGGDLSSYESGPNAYKPEIFILEANVNQQPLDGPPTLLVYARKTIKDTEGNVVENGRLKCKSETETDWVWDSYGEERLFIPKKKADGTLTLGDSRLVTRKSFGLGYHSGGANQSVRVGDKTFVVWGASNKDAPVKDSTGTVVGYKDFCHGEGADLFHNSQKDRDDIATPIGSSIFISEFDNNANPDISPYTVTLTKAKTKSLPANDSHNQSGIVVDKKGYLHVITGAHNYPFYYYKSPFPHTAREEGTENVWPDGAWTISKELCLDTDEAACRHERIDVATDSTQTINFPEQSYLSFVIDEHDTIYILYRQQRDDYHAKHTAAGHDTDDANPYVYRPATDNNGYHALVFQKKDAGMPWGKPKTIVVPPTTVYAKYHNKLGIDRDGSLYLTYSYTTKLSCQNGTEGVYRSNKIPDYAFPKMLVSHNQGDTWNLAAGEDFAQGINWAPIDTVPAVLGYLL